jgi:hypothetical protein
MYNVYQNNYSMQPQRPQQDVISNLFGNIQNFQQQKQQLEQQLQQSGQSPEQLVRGLISSGQMTQEQFMQYSQIANMLSGGLR